jgi:hypothetical protein
VTQEHVGQVGNLRRVGNPPFSCCRRRRVGQPALPDTEDSYLAARHEAALAANKWRVTNPPQAASLPHSVFYQGRSK